MRQLKYISEAAEVSEETLNRLLYKCEDVLSFEHKERKFGLDIRHKVKYGNVIIEAAYNPPTVEFITKTIEDEAVLFHEGVHYLMHQNGLLLPQSSKEDLLMLHNKLVNETMAEFATSEVYPFNERMANPDYESVKKDWEEFEEKTSTKLFRLLPGIPGGSGSEIIGQEKRNGLLPLEIRDKHREIERDYSSHGDLEKTSEKIGEFYSFLNSLGDTPFLLRWIVESISYISVGNAVNLRNEGLKPKDLVSWIEDGIKKEMNGFGIYFCYIIGRETS